MKRHRIVLMMFQTQVLKDGRKEEIASIRRTLLCYIRKLLISSAKETIYRMYRLPHMSQDVNLKLPGISSFPEAILSANQSG